MPQRTFVDVLCRVAGPRPAVSGPDAPTLDYVSFCNAADAVGAALVVRGVRPGDRVAASFPDGVAYLAAFAGTALARAAFVPLIDDEDVSERLGRVPPRMILAAESAAPDLHDSARAASIPLVTLGFDTRGNALIDGEHVYEAHGARVLPDDVAFIALDGTAATQAALVEAVEEHSAFSSTTVRLASPLSTLPGLTAALAVLGGGGHLVIGNGALTRERVLLGN